MTTLVVTLSKPWSTPEQYELLQAYLAVRHPAGHGGDG
jgi:arginine-tRNA-protein transferase